ncbi:uncharacterized protein LOC128400831 isoform X3 [Podarcis raffonei]|uniref:uncharacterized protein LOC128400831 isoform X3 n=1 Tax=Podarcis raffonei TaxID=65483 RepID=UPI0023296F1A|nr:uncharacterized protein LOC128400831 isoform X3 [Podarcis raffonei]
MCEKERTKAMVARRGPLRRRLRLLKLAFMFLLLLLPLLFSGAASGNPCFVNKMCLLRRRTMHLKRETRDTPAESETEYDNTSYVPEDLPASDNQITGAEERTVPAYILIYSNSLILNCLTEKLLVEGIIDPKYVWSGPRGQITRVYHMPEKSLRLSSEFTVQTCETNAVASFEKHFLKKLESLVYNLGCEIKQWSTQCHASTDTLEKITHKLTFQFVVFPLALTTADLCRSSQCGNSTSNMKEAYTKISEFFEVENAHSSHSDYSSYLHGTLNAVKVDHCKPGFGKIINALSNNTECPGCCVTCPPGRFSAEYGTICTLCPAGSYNEKYGQAACENCPKTQSSDGEGAKTGRSCHKILPMWMVFLISSAGTSLILVTIWVIISRCCKKTIAAQYIREAESGLKRRLQAFANIASDAEVEEQRSKLSPIKMHRNKVDFLEDESVGLLSNDEATEPPTTAGTSPSPVQTGLSDLESSFEDKSIPTLDNDNFIPKDLPPNQQRLVDIMKHNLP